MLCRTPEETIATLPAPQPGLRRAARGCTARSRRRGAGSSLSAWHNGCTIHPQKAPLTSVIYFMILEKLFLSNKPTLTDK